MLAGTDDSGATETGRGGRSWYWWWRPLSWWPSRYL